MFDLTHLYTSFPIGKSYQERILSLPVLIPHRDAWQNHAVMEARPKHWRKSKEMDYNVQN